MSEQDFKQNYEPIKKLFNAAFEELKVVEFYKEWREIIDFENISYCEYELLPKVYSHLQKANYKDELTLKIKGITRKNWLETKIYLKELNTFFEILDTSGIEFILLSREPLIYSQLKKKESDFSMRGFQILVRSAFTTTILKKLEKADWKPQNLVDLKTLNFENFWFKHKKNISINVKLKSRIFTDDVWNTLETVQLNGKKINILGLEEYLLQLLESEYLPLANKKNALWILNTLLTLQNSSQIDWEKLSRKSHSLKLNFALVEMLDDVSGIVEWNDFLKSRYRFFKKPENKLQRAFSAYRSLKKSYGKTGEKFSIRGFIYFLREHWQIKSFIQFVEQLRRKFFKY